MDTNRALILAKKVVIKFFRLITIGNDKPKILKEAGLDCFWDDLKIQAMDAPTTEMSINELEWNLDLPFWEEERIDDWNLTPRETLENPKYFPTHYKRIEGVDLNYPICITKNKVGRWFVLDGTHRLAKAFLNDIKIIRVKIITGERLSEIIKVRDRVSC